MKILLINPNTTSVITEKMAAAARQFMPDVEVMPATGRFGAQYIASRASYAIAGHAALDCLAEHGRECNAILLACFGDPGLDAMREVSPSPVISLVDASCSEAGTSGRRFSIVTGGERWGPMLEEMISLKGLQHQLASIRTVAPTGGAIAADPEGAYALLIKTCNKCVDDDGAEAVILGGAGLLSIAAIIQPKVSVPLVCSVEAGFRATLAALKAKEPAGKIAGCDPVSSVGLSSALSALLKDGRLTS